MATERTIDRKGFHLADRIRDGDPNAEEELVDTYRRPVFAVAVARVRDPEAAKDLTQEILLAVLESLRAGRLKENERLSAFIQGTARNRINTYFASLRTARNRPPLPAPLRPATPDDEYEQAERWRLVRRALARLNREDQKILLWTLVDGLKPGEIAERLGISSERLRKRKSRALQRVKTAVLGMSRR